MGGLFELRSCTVTIGEGNGTPLQCSCLENPRDGGAWWAAVYGVAQSRTRLKPLSSSSSNCHHWKGLSDHLLSEMRIRKSKHVIQGHHTNRLEVTSPASSPVLRCPEHCHFHSSLSLHDNQLTYLESKTILSSNLSPVNC